MSGHKLRAVRRGDAYALAVDGGIRRAKAPGDGLLVVLEDRDIFLPLDEVVAVVSQIAPRAAPRRATNPYGVLPGDDPDKR